MTLDKRYVGLSSNSHYFEVKNGLQNKITSQN